MNRSEKWSGWGQTLARIFIVLGICLLAMSGSLQAKHQSNASLPSIDKSLSYKDGELSETSEASDTTDDGTLLTDAPNAEVNSSLVELPSTAQTDLVSVIAVIDGDTIEVTINNAAEKVRLIGIDTPETLDQRKPVQCFGREASDHTHALLDGKQVRLENDSLVGDRDKYHRLLRYVYLDDSLINQVLIQDGYAHEYTYQTAYRYQIDFKNAELEAQRAGRGLWSPFTCNGDTLKPA